MRTGQDGGKCQAQAEAALIGSVLDLRRRGLWWWSALLALVRRRPVSMLCGFILLVFVALALAAPFVAPYDPSEQDLSNRLLGPSRMHPFGTDQLGRDILSRTIYGGRVSLATGLGVMILGGGLSALLGSLSGYLGGKVDAIVQRFVDAFLSIPALVLLMTMLSVVGISMLKMILAIAVWAMVANSRTVRGAVLSVKTRQYTEAARSVGAGSVRILLRYVLPNVIAPIIVICTLLFGVAVIIEATLSFLGYGVPPPTPTWGGMLSGDSRSYMLEAPWMAIAPGTALTLVVVAINLFGDGLRDLLDPRLRGTW